ncbi:MAG: recombination protein O N-terminal domain-containing protein [Treponema sp.]|nr:recombination protein O N-terminal domain-containing protein [Treponema sp.]
MPRSFTYSAITLRIRQSGQSNREAWFLTAEEGVVQATLFGGPKSRLRAQVSPFHEGTLWIYHDTVRDSRKVTDFDVHSYRPGIRELYERAMTADAAAQTILSSHGGGGSWPVAAKLAASVLDCLDWADAALCSRLGVYFLWRWAGVLGLKPEISSCSSCFCQMKRDEPLWYCAVDGALLCGPCAQRETRLPAHSPSLLRLGGGARLWLDSIESLPPAALARITLDGPSLEQARALSKAVLAGALGKRLPTWEEI